MTLRTYRNRKKAEAWDEFEGQDLTRIVNVKRPLETYKIGFIVICPDRNLGGFQNTVLSIRQQYPFAKVLGVVGDDATDSDLENMSQHCESVKGGNTITSLINIGMKTSQAPWNVIVFAGSWVTGNIYRQFDAFVKSDKDILFPVVDGRTNFVDGSMNGIVVHRDTFAEVGDFIAHPLHKEGYSEIEFIKLWWAMGAIDKGCVFKAIIGMKVV